LERLLRAQGGAVIHLSPLPVGKSS